MTRDAAEPSHELLRELPREVRDEARQEVQQVVSRTLRDSLGKLQRTTDELNQAINDLVAACASTRPSNSLPSMLRAQTSAASLAASLEVLSRFVATTLQPPPLRLPEGMSPVRAESSPQVEVIPDHASRTTAPTAVVEVSHVVELSQPSAAPEITAMQEQHAQKNFETPLRTPLQTLEVMDASDIQAGAQLFAEERAPAVAEPAASAQSDAFGDSSGPAQSAGYDSVVPEAAGSFDLAALPHPLQELHRRANRVAKVSMQDIQMLRPEDVRLGRENQDLCLRLRNDIEKAHKEYDRRFQAILDHPVDYFYDWMVEILGNGNASALGEYPYSSPVLRR